MQTTNTSMHAPDPRRAAIAVAVAPFLVVLAFTLVIAGVVETFTALGVFTACTAWLVYELHRYQQQMDGDAAAVLVQRPEAGVDRSYFRELSSDGGGV